MHTPVATEHLNQFKYIDAVLKETLQLHPIASSYSLQLKEGIDDIVIARKYNITKDITVQICLPAVHCDSKVRGDHAEELKPERMLDGKFEALPPSAWRPVGNGMRACIGRQFAWQEALLTMATTFQSFEFRKAGPNYTLQIVRRSPSSPLIFKYTQHHGKGPRSLSCPTVCRKRPRKQPTMGTTCPKAKSCVHQCKYILGQTRERVRHSPRGWPRELHGTASQRRSHHWMLNALSFPLIFRL